ncbi:hypothetical protein FRC17_009909 [Serendipita sp. 399]|nr:hypothetical protein FRC17_009909 [Serendipita sp. 399]
MTSRTAICIPTTSTSQDRVVPDSDEEGDSLLLCANSHAPLENERYRRIAEDIIEISDSDSKRRSGCSTIDLSDDSSVASLPPNQVAKSRVIVRQPVERPNPSPSKTQILQKLFEDSSDSDSAVLDLSRFRWKPQTQTHQPKPPLHSVRPTLVVPLLARNPSKSVRMVHTKNYSFTDAELGPLLRCVSCDVTWTTRKMVSNKLAHIRSCQKKHELDDDTIRERIQRELDSIQADEVQVLNPKKKRKPAPVQEGGPSSLLEEIAQGVRPKQRRKAKEVVTTVIGIEHQHEFFSERAKRKFSLDSEENGETFSGESSSGTGEAGDRSKSPVLTQPFPSSKLGVNEPFHTGYSYELPMFAAEGNRVVG